MRRHLFFFSYFSAFFLLARTLDSEYNEPTYKFGILAGEPTSLNASTAVTVASFDECVEKCLDDFECILASQNASTAPCNLFKWNTVTGVRTNESGGEGLVAFRLFTDQPACDLNLPLLLNGKTYQLYPNDTEEYLWRIDTSEEGFNITYLRTRQDGGAICGNWSFDRPYSDGCNPECLITMVQMYAKPGPLPNLQKYPTPRQIDAENWDACVNGCWKQRQCIAVWWQPDSQNCTWYAAQDELYFIKRTSAEDGNQMALKLSLNNETCKYTTEQLLNDTYFMADGKHIQSSWNQQQYGITTNTTYMPFWRIRTTSEYIVINFYEKETTDIRGNSGCPVEFWPSEPYGNWNYTYCYRPFMTPGMTAVEAQNLCGLIGGFLMPPVYSKMFAKPPGDAAVRIWEADMGPTENQWGIYQSLDPTHFKIWAGMSTDPVCASDTTTTFCKSNLRWRMTDPSVPILYGPNQGDPYYALPQKGRVFYEFSWDSTDGQPIISPQKNCVYYKVTPASKDGDRTFLLYTSECDRTDVDGFICAMRPQQRQGIPAYMDMADKYGFTEPPYVADPSEFDKEL